MSELPQKPRISGLVLAIGLFCTGPAAAQKDSCSGLLQASPEQTALQAAQTVSEQATVHGEQVLAKQGVQGGTKRGYAILIGTMVGSAALTTFMTSHLPANFQFASVFIGQLTTLGVYVLGAPIWEPISSRFRKWAFGLNKDMNNQTNSTPQLEAAWIRTQENYSLNSQMSRNVISQFILNVRENFYQAYRAHTEGNPVYAADQVADAAYRMRILFKDIDPTDKSVASAISSAFTNHVTVDQQFVELVWARLKRIDVDFEKDETSIFYQTLLETWLSQGAKVLSNTRGATVE